MPLYLLRAFRWPRPLIRVHVVINNVDDCSADWLMGPSGAALASDLYSANPALSAQGVTIDIFEPYDPADERRHTGNFAFVACEWQELGRLCGRVDGVVGGLGLGGLGWEGLSWGGLDRPGGLDWGGLGSADTAGGWNGVGKEGDAFEALKSLLAPGEEIGWWVVWCGEGRRGIASSPGGSGKSGSPISMRSWDTSPYEGNGNTNSIPRPGEPIPPVSPSTWTEVLGERKGLRTWVKNVVLSPRLATATPPPTAKTPTPSTETEEGEEEERTRKKKTATNYAHGFGFGFHSPSPRRRGENGFFSR